MRTLFFTSLFALSLLTGCAQFEKNVEADQNATKLSSVNATQSSDVDTMAADGQINSYEQEQMQEAINGN
ncbi:MAG: hypothetical protein ACQKBW_13535 [Puniceicoccales bacterium]